MSSVVESRNRVRYIEPSNVMYNDDGSEKIMPSNVAYNNSLENLDLALDLQVVLFDRKSCGIPTETGGGVVFNYSTNRGTMSFLKGTDGVLTTNYTDVNLMHPDINTEECLGIESIDIQYQSWMYPDVTIKFVDVRGATVMSKAEKEYQDRDSGGSFSLYKALFTYPYPLFKLKVKGFYGRGATYYLSIENVKMEFNADTGNFEIIVHFIGMMFRAYADLPMTYITIAPYTDDGNKYWKESVKNGRFQFHNPDGSTHDMMTYVELRKKLWEFTKDLDRKKILADGETEGANLKEKKAALSLIVDRCPVSDSAWVQDGYLYDISYQGDTVKKAEIADRADAFLSALKSYDDAWNKDTGISYYKMFEGIDGYANSGSTAYTSIQEVKYVRDKSTGKFVCTSETSANEGKYINNHGQESDLRKRLEKRKEGESKPSFMVYVMTAQTQNFQQFIDNTIKPEIESVEKRINSIAAEYREKEEQYLEEFLGFRPSIKNMYDLAFAHMDTFVHIFNNCTSIIRSQIEANDRTRDVSTYGGTSDMASGDGMLPPFPALYKEEASMRNSGVSRNVEVWPEDIPNGSDMAEVAFVKSFISGAKKYFDDRQAQADLEDASTGTGDVSVKNMIPLTTYDFAHATETVVNPYRFLGNVWSQSTQSADRTAFKDAVMGVFALRAYNYMSTNGYANNIPEMFGKLEAANFYKALGVRADREFTSFITNSSADSFISTITSNSQVWPSTGRLTGRLMRTTGSTNIAYNLHNYGDTSYFPVGFESFQQCQSDLGLGGYVLGKYINIQDLDGMPESHSSCPRIFEQGYLGKIYEAVKNEITESESETSGATKSTINIMDVDKTLSCYGDTLISNSKTQPPYKDGTLDMTTQYTWKTCVENNDFSSVKIQRVIQGKPMYDYVGFTENSSSSNESVMARAYIFLFSLRLVSENFGMRTEARNKEELYLSLLREGAVYWRGHKTHGWDSLPENPTQQQIASCDPIKVPSDYVHPNRYELFARKNESNDSKFVFLTDGYAKFKYPDGSTRDERNQLLKLFTDWALDPDGYMSIDIDLRNQSLWNKDVITFSDKAQSELRNVCFTNKTVLDYYHGANGDKGTKFIVPSTQMVNAYKSFLSALKTIYSEYGTTENEIATAAAMQNVEDPFNNKDIRLATYLGMKQLYDKWLCSPYRGSGTWKMGHQDSEFESFTYIDSFYHDIGLELMVNATQIVKSLDMCLPVSSAEFVDGNPNYKNKSLYEFLAEIAQNCGGILLALPQKIGGCNEQYMADMFRAMPYASDWETDSSSFIFLYTYKESEHLGNDQYKDDGFDLTAEQVISSLSDTGYDIPAFGVSYAKQNQAYFKNIRLSTENSIMTEEAIQATMDIASQGSSGPRLTTAFGQDLYRVRTSYAYQCEFDMMGDVQIMPLMYFQLNNIPFWRGAYHIIKVSHKITDGDMVTHVTGIRANKNALPMAAGYLTVNRDTGHCIGGAFAQGAAGTASDGSTVGIDSSSVEYTNDNVTGDPNQKLSDPVDFKGVVDAAHPIVCLTPCHGPLQSDRWMEWNWSKTLIDNYIIPKLNQKTYKDGTKINIQRCNKNGNHTDANSCRMTETENLIKKYGSSCVISINPHWNVGFATYNVTMHGLKSNNRRDSETLAKQFVRAADAAKKKSMTYNKMPEGLMSGKVVNKLSKNDNIYALKVKCPCVETMNWFYDYPLLQMCHKAKTSSDYQGRADWKDKDESGRYILAEGWLYDEQGMNTIADIHVNAIMAYLEIVYNAVGVSNGTVTGPYNVPNTQAANINWYGQNIPAGLNPW